MTTTGKRERNAAVRLLVPLALTAAAAPAASADPGSSHYRGLARVMGSHAHATVHDGAKRVRVRR